MWAVSHWKQISHPHEQAMDAASKDGGGISCSDYLRARREAFDTATHPRNAEQKIKKSPVATANSDGENGHGNPRAKACRAKIFAAWIAENILSSNGRALDVAGGKGLLSVELAARNIPCTVVDPMLRKQPTGRIKQLVKQGKPVPDIVARYFDDSWSIQDLAAHTCLVSLHPDQCTEAILDVALRHRKSVAIVPCCVFPCLFPIRRLSSEQPVRTYQDFLLYLLQKDERLRMTTLPFDGKNECIYLKVVDAYIC